MVAFIFDQGTLKNLWKCDNGFFRLFCSKIKRQERYCSRPRGFAPTQAMTQNLSFISFRGGSML